MKKIPLSQQGKHRGKYFALVDDEDYEFINKLRWSLSNKYASARVKKNGVTISIKMQRMIMNTPNGMDTDHINGNPLDNRRKNLRVCTRSQNMRNILKKKVGTSKYKGVHWSERDKRWIAQIHIKGKGRCIGYFKEEKEAALAYDQEVKRIEGEYAILNMADKKNVESNLIHESGDVSTHAIVKNEVIKGMIELSKRGKNNGVYAIVDENDYDWLNQWNWFITGAGYAARQGKLKNGGLKQVLMHRAVMGAKKGVGVDHINNNKLDNRKCNLRVCTQQQNAFNIQKKSKAVSVFKGVTLDKRDNIWIARIGHNLKRIHIGRFVNEDDAARAYDRKAKELFGEFANLNFPQSA